MEIRLKFLCSLGQQSLVEGLFSKDYPELLHLAEVCEFLFVERLNRVQAIVVV